MRGLYRFVNCRLMIKTGFYHFSGNSGHHLVHLPRKSTKNAHFILFFSFFSLKSIICNYFWTGVFQSGIVVEGKLLIRIPQD